MCDSAGGGPFVSAILQQLSSAGDLHGSVAP